MADRNLVHYEEERNPEGPYWTLDIDRSAAGQPGLFFTIESKTFSEADRHIESLNQRMTIVVKDGDALLRPVLEWLQKGAAPDSEPAAADKCAYCGVPLIDGWRHPKATA